LFFFWEGLFEEINAPNSSHKPDFIREDCPLLINMPKILSTSNVELFFNRLQKRECDYRVSKDEKLNQFKGSIFYFYDHTRGGKAEMRIRISDFCFMRCGF
jgi:hypothetical protein